jgi:hypothetical protein
MMHSTPQACIALLLTIIGLSLNSRAQEITSRRGKCEAVNKSNFRDEHDKSVYEDMKGPDGSWGVMVRPDQYSELEAKCPASIVNLSTIMGGKGAKITRGSVCNHSEKIITAMSIRWILADQQDTYTPLVQGSTPIFATEIPSKKMLYTDFPFINFATISKPLVKDGLLNGKFILRVRVHEVHFEDGSV